MNLIKVTLDIGGFKEEIKSASENIKREIDAETQAAAMQFRDYAKRDLVAQAGDRGTLYRSINYKKNKDFNYTVSADAPYAAFIEFGTKDGYRAQTGLEDYAQQFQGIKNIGTLGLIDAIKGWVIRKGIAQGKDADRAAFLIARKIKEKGIEARPFFFKQMSIVKEDLIKNIQQVLNDI